MKAYDTVIAALALMGFIILGWVTAFGTSDFHANPAQLELALEESARAKLQEQGHDWALVEFNGQSARVFGTPVSEEAAREAVQAVLTSSGDGGLLFGGVTQVETAFEPVVEMPLISPYILRVVKSTNGALMLLGHVPSDSVRERLLSQAGALSPEDAADRLDLGRGALPRDWTDTVSFGLDQMPFIDMGELRFEDQNITLKGVALNDGNRIRVVAEFANLEAPWQAEVKLRGQSHWQAEHIGETLVLSGKVDDDFMMTKLAAIAAEHFDGQVVNEMVSEASDYEDWTDRVEAGLPHFAKFQSGEFEFDPKGVGYFVDGEASASTLKYLQEDMASVESPFGIELEAAPVAVALEELEGVDLGADPVSVCQSSFELIMANNKVYFDTGNAVITRRSGLTLDKILAVAETCAPEVELEIGGHTDSSGDAGANLVLSEARADAVATYLEAAGFDRTRLNVRGYGANEPAFDNATEAGRAKNRRIEFKVQERSE